MTADRIQACRDQGRRMNRLPPNIIYEYIRTHIIKLRSFKKFPAWKMVKKSKNTPCKGRWCDHHLFSLRPYLQSRPHQIQETLRLCPKYNKTTKTFQKITPLLNLDFKYYTPLFILEQDERLYTNHNDRTLLNFHDNQFLEEYQISQIVHLLAIIPLELSLFVSLDMMQMVARLGLGKHYCKVCKDDYEDYLQHIGSVEHCSRLSANPYSKFIVELEQSLKLNQPLQPYKYTNLIRPLESLHDTEMDSLLMEKETELKLRPFDSSKQLEQNCA